MKDESGPALPGREQKEETQMQKNTYRALSMACLSIAASLLIACGVGESPTAPESYVAAPERASSTVAAPVHASQGQNKDVTWSDSLWGTSGKYKNRSGEEDGPALIILFRTDLVPQVEVGRGKLETAKAHSEQVFYAEVEDKTLCGVPIEAELGRLSGLGASGHFTPFGIIGSHGFGTPHCTTPKSKPTPPPDACVTIEPTATGFRVRPSLRAAELHCPCPGQFEVGQISLTNTTLTAVTQDQALSALWSPSAGLTGTVTVGPAASIVSGYAGSSAQTGAVSGTTTFARLGEPYVTSDTFIVTGAGNDVCFSLSIGVLVSPISVPPPIDVCPNLEGNQSTVPDGYEVVNGLCVPIVIPPPPPETTE